jgi:DNA polymerase-3 subunit alpha
MSDTPEIVPAAEPPPPPPPPKVEKPAPPRAVDSDSFVHLHLHTEYSPLDGAVRIPELMAKAKKMGMPAVAMTDHGNLYGAIEFYQEAKKAGIKPIIGCEIYLAPGSMHDKTPTPGRKNASHLTLLAADEKGYHSLLKLVSKAHLEGFYHKPRVDKETLYEFRDGIICLSGCLNGEINQFIRGDQLTQAKKSLADFRDIYGDENLYLEMHNHGMDDQMKCNRQLMEWSKEFDLKTVAANDVHFLDAKDHEFHDVMICIGTGANVFDEKRMHYSKEVYFKKPQDMKKLFKEVPQAIRSTLEIADRCDLTLKLDSSSSEKYPEYTPPGSKTREEYFHDLCWDGLRKRYGENADQDTKLRERLEYEMGIIQRMKFISYFLITWDFIKWAKDNGIPVGPGRGSAAGSIVAYVLEITDIEPLRYNLLFERFLNPERISPPDVDVDFCQARRGEVIEYVRQKYGNRSVSQIITFGTLGAKSVIRDVGRVMGLGYTESDRIAKMIPAELNITLADARKKNPELKEAIEKDPAIARLYETANYLEGLTRGTGVHAAGVVIGDCDLAEHIPLTAGKDGEVVTQYAMGPLTDVGMLKMDFLGLTTLTIIQEAENLIHRHTPGFRTDQIPLDDAPAFALLNRGETCGVFQLESGGMVNLCKQFGVDRIEDIIALIALYRPGPMELIPDYIERKKGKKKVVYEHPLLEQVSSETYGIMIYQEQVMQAASFLAGFTLGDADLLRRAMGKKKVEEMAKQRAKFVEGCERVNQIKEKLANEIFDLLEKFAGYGFNKSHSAAYGMISYRTAYLKANYPVEFMCGLLSLALSNMDKITIFVNECKNMGIDLLPPDVNYSMPKFVPEIREGEPNGIRFGLAAIKGVGEAVVDMMISEREANGLFKSAEDFARRVDSRAVNKRVLESLIKAGAFDFCEKNRALLFSRIDQIVAGGASAQKDKASGQISLFGEEEDFSTMAPAPVDDSGPVVEPWSMSDTLQHEKELLGFYVSGHPLDPWRPALQNSSYQKIGTLVENKNRFKGKKVKLGVFINEVTVKYTKSGKQFAILKGEDFTGQNEIIVWGEDWDKIGKLLVKGTAMEIQAKVELDSRSDGVQLIASAAKPLPMGNPGDGATVADPAHHEDPDQADRDRNGVNILTLQLDSNNDDIITLHRIQRILCEYPGSTPVHLTIKRMGQDSVKLIASHRYNVRESPALLERLARWL